ncbi:hypothetical protein Glove_423g79 [Diversispora epigaea]|uniref:Jacalin-type lectin domain-containing protein n=1 Tax=Diversispora epigaea TaxID=1348612 RepID=A0A397GYQ5_9GLOM|nr:hypothetical protein Glove_423g79 [Diversispora epigaea]
MFAQLCMISTFFLVAITTIAIELPLEESRNPTLNRRLIPPGSPQCNNPRFPAFRSSSCKTKTTYSALCEIRESAGETSINQCPPSTSCIDFASRNLTPFAFCVLDSQVKTWGNDGKNKEICTGKFKPNFQKGAITIGMTTYGTNGNTIQVDFLGTFVNDTFLSSVFTADSHSAIFSGYDVNDDVNLCFSGGNSGVPVTSFGAVLSGLF